MKPHDLALEFGGLQIADTQGVRNVMQKTKKPMSFLQKSYPLTWCNCNSFFKSTGKFEADRRYQLIAAEPEGSTDDNKYILQLFIMLTRNDKTRPLGYHERQGEYKDPDPQKGTIPGPYFINVYNQTLSRFSPELNLFVNFAPETYGQG